MNTIDNIFPLTLAPICYAYEKPNILDSENPHENWVIQESADELANELVKNSNSEFSVEYPASENDMNLLHEYQKKLHEHGDSPKWDTDGWHLSWNWVDKKLCILNGIKLTVEEAETSEAISQHSGHVTEKHVVPNPTSGETKLIKCKIETCDSFSKESEITDYGFKIKVDDLYQGGRTIFRDEGNFVDGVYEFSFESPKESSYLVKVKPHTRGLYTRRLTTLLKVND